MPEDALGGGRAWRHILSTPEYRSFSPPCCPAALAPCCLISAGVNFIPQPLHSLFLLSKTTESRISLLRILRLVRDSPFTLYRFYPIVISTFRQHGYPKGIPLVL